MLSLKKLLNTSRAILTLFFCLNSIIVFAQNSRILIYANNTELTSTNTVAITRLQSSAAKHKAELVFADANSFDESQLKTVQAVVFINSNINELNFRQATELERFIKAGGGFVGIGAAAQKNYQWLWFQKMIQGTLAEKQLQNTAQISVITNAFIGKTSLQPLWRIEDKPLVFNALPVMCKPVLLDVMGKTWSWYYQTENGGKLFYTAFGTQASAFQNDEFMNHIWAGIEEVLSKQLPDYQKVADSALPLENRFLKQVLANNLTDAVSMVFLPQGNIMVLEQSGAVKLFDENTKYMRTVGVLPAAEKIKSIKLDPEFEQNKIVYTFEPQNEEFLIKRFQLVGDSIAINQDFVSQSHTLPEKSVKYQYQNFENAPYRLPKYYQHKVFRYDPEKGLLAESYKNDELMNIEPFVASMKFNYIKDLAIGRGGELYILENSQLLKIDYAEKNRKPIAVATANVYEGVLPLTVSFSSAGSLDYDIEDKLSYEWRFDAMNISYEPNPVFTYSQAGDYVVSLKITDSFGESVMSQISIKVAKTLVKKKK